MRDVIAVSTILVLGVAVASAAPATYSVDEAKSTVRVHVGKSGAFSFAGHRHEVEAPVIGTITADAANLAASSVELTFAGERMRVLPEGEPAGDAPKVEGIMKSARVLDVARFPEIRFQSKTVSGQPGAGGRYELRVSGELSLHGITREITVPMTVTLEGTTLTAVGRTAIRHDQFGMTPVSAGGGTVKVANEIAVDVRIFAEKR